MTDQSVTKRPKAKRRRRGRPRDAGLANRRREQILDAATGLFAAEGFHATDLQTLADELGLAKGTLYRYFPTKRALFLASVDRVMLLMREAIDLAINGVVDPLEQVAVAIRAYLVFFSEHPEFVELLIHERAVFRDRKKPTYFEHRERNIGRWHQLYSELITAGRLRPLAPDAITDVLSSTLYGTMFTNFFAGRSKSLDQQVQQILDIVFHGIVTDDERRRTKESLS